MILYNEIRKRQEENLSEKEIRTMNITRYDNYEFETFYGDVYGNNYDEYVYPDPIEISYYGYGDDSCYAWK